MSPFNIAWSLLKRAEGYDDNVYQSRQFSGASPPPPKPYVPPPQDTYEDPTMMDDDWDEPAPQEEPPPKDVFTSKKPWKTPQEADEDEQRRYEDDDWKKVLDEKVRDRAGPATEGPVSPFTMPPSQNSPPPYQTQGMPAPRR